MVICKNEARRIDDESGTRSTPRRVGLLPLRPLEKVWSIWKQRPATRAAIAGRRRGIDVDDRGIESFCDIGERDGSGR